MCSAKCADPPVRRRHRLEQAITVLQPAVVGRDGAAVDAVDEAPPHQRVAPECAQQAARLGAGLLELGLRRGIGHDAGAGAELDVAIVDGDRPDQDVEIERAIEAQVAHRTRVRVARLALEFRQQLHAAHLRAAGDRAAGKYRRDRLSGRHARRRSSPRTFETMWCTCA